MEDAVKVIKRKFKHMKGFELHKVYFVDDEFSESTLQAVNAKGNAIKQHLQRPERHRNQALDASLYVMV